MSSLTRQTESKLESGGLDQLDDLLQQVARLAAELPGDDGPLAQDEDFQRQLNQLQIDLLGARALAARTDRQPVLGAALELRLKQLRTRLCELTISTLGYHALPDPQPLLIDNEGPIGHHLALQLMHDVADYFAPLDPQDGEYGVREKLAGLLFMQPAR